MHKIISYLFLIVIFTSLLSEPIEEEGQKAAFLVEINQPDEALKLYRSLLEQSREPWQKSRILYNIGTAFMKKRKWNKAVQAFDLANQTDPSSTDLLYRLSYNRALAYLEKVQEKEERLSPSILLDLSTGELLKDLAEAENSLRTSYLIGCQGEVCPPTSDLLALHRAITNEKINISESEEAHQRKQITPLEALTQLYEQDALLRMWLESLRKSNKEEAKRFVDAYTLQESKRVPLWKNVEESFKWVALPTEEDKKHLDRRKLLYERAKSTYKTLIGRLENQSFEQAEISLMLLQQHIRALIGIELGDDIVEAILIERVELLRSIDSPFSKTYAIAAKNEFNQISDLAAQWLFSLHNSLKQYSEGDSSLAKIQNALSELANAIQYGTGDPRQELIFYQQLLDSLAPSPVKQLMQETALAYAFTLAKSRIEAGELAKIEDKERQLKGLIELGDGGRILKSSDSKITRNLMRAEANRKSAQEALNKNELKTARLMAQNAFFWTYLALEEAVEPIQSPIALLASALYAQKQAIDLSIAATLNPIASIRESAQEVQQETVDLGELFPSVVKAYQENSFSKKECQEQPWKKVIPQFFRGYQAAENALKDPENHKAQETAYVEWKKALSLLLAHQQHRLNQPESSESETEEDELPIQEVMQLLQQLEIQDRLPDRKAKEVIKGDKPW